MATMAQTGKVFRDRRDAGRQLADLLARFYTDQRLVLLALPRGGLPVAAEIAERLGRPLDVLIVRKLGVPGYEELAMGALASGGVQVLNHDIISGLRVSREQVDAVIQQESAELARREKLYRGDRPFPAIAGRTVMVVDDGIATGATMFAAVELLRQQNAGRIVVAVPVAPPDTVERLRKEADEVIAVAEPEQFGSVGHWYADFSQTGDDEVRELLEVAAESKGSNGGGA
ncbi:MAG: phosphoribosyltransferase [Verrucomicrobiota bacterium]